MPFPSPSVDYPGGPLTSTKLRSIAIEDSESGAEGMNGKAQKKEELEELERGDPAGCVV